MTELDMVTQNLEKPMCEERMQFEVGSVKLAASSSPSLDHSSNQMAFSPGQPSSASTYS